MTFSFRPTIGKLDGVTSFIYYNFRSKLSVEAGSTQAGDPFNIVDPTKMCGTIDCIWHSDASAPSGNITIKLGIPLFITNYTLRTRPEASGFPINWIVEGSNKGDTWDRIATVNNEQGLKGNNIAKTFPCDKPGIYKMFRFTMIGINTNGDYGFALYKVELFGNLMLDCMIRTVSRRLSYIKSLILFSGIMI